MRLKKGENVEPFKFEEVIRPWGYYGLYADNVKSTTKILYVKKNETLSLQYHLKRAQFYLLLSDNFIIQYSSTPIPLDIVNMSDFDDKKFKLIENFLDINLITIEANKLDMFGFHEYVIHRAKYVGKEEYGMILDVAFGINDENDIFRIKDAYNRTSFSNI
jgi:hypothetical protein